MFTQLSIINAKVCLEIKDKRKMDDRYNSSDSDSDGQPPDRRPISKQALEALRVLGRILFFTSLYRPGMVFWAMDLFAT